MRGCLTRVKTMDWSPALTFSRCVSDTEAENCEAANQTVEIFGLPEISGSSPPTTTALAPNLCASRALETNWQAPRCTRAIQGSKRSGMFGSMTHSEGHPVLSESL